MVVTWLVDEGAVEGLDYSLERLLAVWRRTSEQDWALCERNQRGVRSPAYVPGPLSGRHEVNVAAFHEWYSGNARLTAIASLAGIPGQTSSRRSRPKWPGPRP